MTWKEIKDAVEAKGIKDDDKINHIDVSADLSDIVNGVEARKHEELNEWEIWN